VIQRKDAKRLPKILLSKQLEREAGGLRQQNAECQPDERDVAMLTVRDIIRLIAAPTVA